MNTNYIKKLIRLVEESKIESLEVSNWGRKVRIVQKANSSENGHGAAPVVWPIAGSPPSAEQVQASVPTTSASTVKETPPEDSSRYTEIKSPMVGTFYAASSPDSPPYVSLNEKITEGQVVCIVEAMKLMNEIESEVSGRVVKILVENAQPIEFGQILFLIEPD
ncbi:MAG: acetyl-CoA carboxylase biotin carboxyl carrier protein [candidate division Zixibacteria bacterium]|nr:acetyl-CoA carboxylase biotin carboxyl carrier protein [candidate division Zixibacteria bacterium]